MKYGFIKVASAVPVAHVADCKRNTEEIKALIVKAEEQKTEVVVFPELCITGYSCQDLFRQRLLLQSAEDCLMDIAHFSKQNNVISIIGLPISVDNLLLNCAAVIQHGKILGIVPKNYLPNYNEFYEKRWFASAQDCREQIINFAGQSILITSAPQLFQIHGGAMFGIEICEDVWAPVPPSNNLVLAGADIIFNLSASDELIGKHNYLKSLLSQQSARMMCGYVYSGAGFGESTQDVVYGGNALIYENGHQLCEGERFSIHRQFISSQIDIDSLRSDRQNNTTFVNAHQSIINQKLHIIDVEETVYEHFLLERNVNPHPFIPHHSNMDESCAEILNIQSMGLIKRLLHTHAEKVVLGVSGGLDSTLALLVCVKAFDKLGYDHRNIIGVTMPGFGTTGRTYQNALNLMQSLGITIKEINISQSVLQHFKDIGQNEKVHDITYENSQARERTQILMDLSNKLNGLVIGTGDLSELALGWATYNGDHMSMYAVNAAVPKTLIKYLLHYIAQNTNPDSAQTLIDIINTPISPELIPADEDGNIKQKTEDLVGPYELHDFFLYYVLRYGFCPKKIFVLAQKAFNSNSLTFSEANQYDDETILYWLYTFYRRFFSQQFKRSCLPDGPKVGSISLSPRGDWRMPTDALSTIWLQQIKDIASDKGLRLDFSHKN